MVKREAFEDSHSMPQAARVGLTDHTGSIVSLMACIFDLKKTFYVTVHLYSVGGLYGSHGMVKMEEFEDSHFMPQVVRVGLTDHTGSIVSLLACIFDLKKTFLCNRTFVLCQRARAIALVW